MPDFPSYYSYGNFANYVMRHNRHFPAVDHAAFLEALWETSAERIKQVSAGSKLCRAQEGCKYVDQIEDGEVVDERAAPFDEARMRPRRDRASEGRANPKGIPCLYLASHRETAIAEVRPWNGAQVSVGIFEILRDLRVVDCSEGEHSFLIFLTGEPGPEVRAEKAWADVNDAFRRPVTRNDDQAWYAPTQIIADLFRAKGLDGIAYGSAVGEGTNFALFNLDCAKMVGAGVFSVTKVTVESEQDGSAGVWNAPTISENPAATRPDDG